MTSSLMAYESESFEAEDTFFLRNFGNGVSCDIEEQTESS
jgi:hypothetical protein